MKSTPLPCLVKIYKKRSLGGVRYSRCIVCRKLVHVTFRVMSFNFGNCMYVLNIASLLAEYFNMARILSKKKSIRSLITKRKNHIHAHKLLKCSIYIFIIFQLFGSCVSLRYCVIDIFHRHTYDIYGCVLCSKISTCNEKNNI